jgi:hypothetical protein
MARNQPRHRVDRSLLYSLVYRLSYSILYGSWEKNNSAEACLESGIEFRIWQVQSDLYDDTQEMVVIGESDKDESGSEDCDKVF